MRVFVVCVVAATCLLARHCLADDLVKMGEVVDLARVKSDPFTSFIQFAFWPSPEFFKENMCRRELIIDDFGDLTNTLERFLVKKYLPTSKDLRGGNGIPNYLGGCDFLFLKYLSKDGLSFEIQDGPITSILVTSAEWKVCPLGKIEGYIRCIATNIFNFPEYPGAQSNFCVFVSSMNIGSSRLGDIAWSCPGELPTVSYNWYSKIMWWSDGKRALFAVAKESKDDYIRMRSSANAPENRPYWFRYRRSSWLRQAFWKLRKQNEPGLCCKSSNLASPTNCPDSLSPSSVGISNSVVPKL